MRLAQMAAEVAAKSPPTPKVVPLDRSSVMDETSRRLSAAEVAAEEAEAEAEAVAAAAAADEEDAVADEEEQEEEESVAGWRRYV